MSNLYILSSHVDIFAVPSPPREQHDAAVRDRFLDRMAMLGPAP